MATMQVLKLATEEEGNQLGPPLSAHVEFKGSTAKGLTHVHSHHCMHEISASSTGKAETKGIGSYGLGSSGQVTLGTPSLLLHNYGGDKFKVVRKLSATTSRGGHTCAATVLVYKDAPLNLLLGMDLHSHSHLPLPAEEDKCNCSRLTPIEEVDHYPGRS